MDTLLGLLAVFALVFVNGFFVAAEFAFVGSRRTRLAQLAEEGSAGAKAAEDAINHLDSYIAATQLGITLASLGLGWIGEPAVAHIFEPLVSRFLPEDIARNVAQPVMAALAFALVTMLHIILGELAPKSIALQRPEDAAVIVSRPTRLFLNIFRPVIRLMNGIGGWVVRMLGFEPASGHSQVHSAEELEMLVHSSREAGLLQESEERLLRRVFDFADIPVQAVMQPRVEIEAFPLDIPFPELLAKVTSSHHSRYPVYEDSIDKVVGILFTKDLLDAIVRQPELLTNGGANFNLKDALRTPMYIPSTVSVDKVLEQMQRKKTHLAVIMDEYGGMAGLATMEDIIEQIVGDVQDEFDTDASPISSQGDTASVDGLVSLTDITDRFGDLETEAESTTIGGYVAEKLDRIPVVGDVVQYGDYDVKVLKMDAMRVERVRFKKRATITGENPALPPADSK
jgi:magnesium and cobalt exporter, CNNM family